MSITSERLREHFTHDVTDAAADEIDKLTAERDKATQYWQIAEGRCDALMKQRDELMVVLEQIVASNPRKWEELAEPQSEFERWAKSRANQAIASVKEKA